MNQVGGHPLNIPGMGYIFCKYNSIILTIACVMYPLYLFWSIDKFNDWGGRGCNVFFPVLGGDGTIIAPTGDIFDQPSGQMR